MNLGLIKEAGKIWHNCLTGDRQNECPPHLPCSICPLVSPAQHSLLSCTEPLHLLERFPHIFERLSSSLPLIIQIWDQMSLLRAAFPTLPSKNCPHPCTSHYASQLNLFGGHLSIPATNYVGPCVCCLSPGRHCFIFLCTVPRQSQE